MLRLTFVFVALALDAQDGDQQRDDDDRSGGQCHQEPRLVVERLLVRIAVLQVQLAGRHKLQSAIHQFTPSLEFLCQQKFTGS